MVDLRYNGGGDSSIGDYFLDYLTSKSYKLASRMDVRLSEALYEKYNDYRQYATLTGLTISRRIDLHQPADRGVKFNGKLYVLIGPRTFSSAEMLAAIVKDYELGILIGEETGATRQGFGDPAHMTLPNSGIHVAVSCKLWFAPIPMLHDDTRGTMPHIQVTRQLVSEYSESKDPVLDFALDQIRKDTR